MSSNFSNHLRRTYIKVLDQNFYKNLMKDAFRNPYKDIVFVYNPSCYLSISYIICCSLGYCLNYENIVHHDIEIAETQH